MVVAHVVDYLLRELLRIGSHVSIHEQVAPNDLEAMLEYGYDSTLENKQVR